MTETPNLHLTKDARNDHYSVDRVNANSDRIDGFAGETAASLSDLDERVGALEEGGVPVDAYTKAETDTLLAAKADQSDLSALSATVAGKQDTISDLAAIRSGASAGATAVQPSAMQAALADKQDTISDLAAIRSGASAGSTAVQPGEFSTALNGKVDKMTGYGLSSNDYTTAEKQKLAGLSNYDDTEVRGLISGKQDAISDLAAIRSGAASGATAVQTIKINGITQTKTGDTVNLQAYPTKSSLGLGNVDNTSDLDKPISTAAQADQQRQDGEIAVIANAGAKSLLPIGVSNTTYANAVTFSIAHDGTITVNGTNPNGYAGIPYADLVEAKNSQLETRYTLPAGKYKITSTGDGLKFQVHCHDGTNASALFSGKNGGEFEYTSELKAQYPYICWRLAIDANASFSNQIVKPMIWNAEIKDSTFQPYAPTNRELYEMILALQNGGA